MFELQAPLPARADGKAWREWQLLLAEHVAAKPKATVSELREVADVSPASIAVARKVPEWGDLVTYFKALHRERMYEKMFEDQAELILHGQSVALATLIESASAGNVDSAMKYLEVTGFVDKSKALATMIATHAARVQGIDTDG